MIASPAERCDAVSSMTRPVTAAGTINHTARGACNFVAMSAADVAPIAPAATSAATAA
jgi:hypothetical protein